MTMEDAAMEAASRMLTRLKTTYRLARRAVRDVHRARSRSISTETTVIVRRAGAECGVGMGQIA